jgi:hypothetical protein
LGKQNIVVFFVFNIFCFRKSSTIEFSHLAYHTQAISLIFLLPSKQWRNGDKPSQHPDSSNHYSHTTWSSLSGIAQWLGYGQVPINADCTQVQYRRRTQQDIERRPNLAE